MNRPKLFLPLFFFLPLLSLASAQKLDMEKLHGLKPRSIGPAGMSGRVTAIDVVLSQPATMYVGTASGGLWKSTSAGIAWTPVFDDQPVSSVGAIAIVQSNPDVIYVGTGEGNPRNSQTSGNGVYKTLDGGKTWTHLELENSRTIHRVLVHPQNSDIVYVAAQGPPWGEGVERGVYKTTDGGQTWQKILYINEKTGPGDLVMAPNNPNKLIASMWEFRRWPWFFKSGGPGSGLHLTVDGGESWKQLTSEDGLPEGELGRIGLAIAASNSNVIYALIEAKKNALYRSDDGGYKWAKIADKNIGNRPFYYADIFVDPSNENRLYNLYSVIDVSEDGGKTFQNLVPWTEVHPDHHAFWIHPEDGNFLIDGNDGGMAISHDRGSTWRFVENLPLAQFYHINIDMETPYHVYGGMQDNGSWRGPSQVWRQGGIRNTYWEEVAFGDGFDVVPDRSDARYGFAMSQGGYLRRYDLVTGHEKLIRPVHPDNIKLRFNWNAAIAADTFDDKTIYYGSQFLHKSTNRGDSWEIISHDLTTNDPEKQKQLDSGGLTYDVTNAENFTTIVAIAPSPLQKEVIWVGTDDGNLQLTQNGGQSWENVIKNIKGVPAGTWIPQIRASTYNPAAAFVLFENHRRNDWTPYVYYTDNFGKSWQRLAADGDVWGFALAIVQDPVEPGLLFLGTEFGLYVSLDFGKSWNKWKSGYSSVSTMDMQLHPRDHDLVIGTFGRAAYILDDIQPLRTLAQQGPNLLNKNIHLFDIPDAFLAYTKEAAGTRFAAGAEFAGENRPYGALLTFVYNPLDTIKSMSKPPAEKTPFSLETAREDTIAVQVLNGDHEIIRTFKRPVKPGINRASWNLTRKGIRSSDTPEPKKEAAEPEGPQVMPGTYTVRIRVGDFADSATVDVKLDPRISVSEAALDKKEKFVERLQRRQEVATKAADRLLEAEKTINAIAAQLKEREDELAKATRESGKALKDSIKSLLELINPKEVQGIRRDASIVSAQLSLSAFYINSSIGDPGETVTLMMQHTEANLKKGLAKINLFFQENWTAYRKSVEAANVSFFEEYEPLNLE